MSKITCAEFLKNTNDEELLAVFSSVWNRVRNKQNIVFTKRKDDKTVAKFVLSDKDLHKAVEKTLKEWEA